MNQGRIIVITGAPGTGKTTTASAVAKESDLEKFLEAAKRYVRGGYDVIVDGIMGNMYFVSIMETPIPVQSH